MTTTTKTTTTVRYVAMITEGKYLRTLTYGRNYRSRSSAPALLSSNCKPVYTDKLSEAKKFRSAKSAGEFLNHCHTDYRKLKLHKITTTKVETIDEDQNSRSKIDGGPTYRVALENHPEYSGLERLLRHAKMHPNKKWLVQLNSCMVDALSTMHDRFEHSKRFLLDLKADIKAAGIKTKSYSIEVGYSSHFSNASFDSSCDSFVLLLKLTYPTVMAHELNIESIQERQLQIREEIFKQVQDYGLDVATIDFKQNV